MQQWSRDQLTTNLWMVISFSNLLLLLLLLPSLYFYLLYICLSTILLFCCLLHVFAVLCYGLHFFNLKNNNKKHVVVCMYNNTYMYLRAYGHIRVRTYVHERAQNFVTWPRTHKHDMTRLCMQSTSRTSSQLYSCSLDYLPVIMYRECTYLHLHDSCVGVRAVIMWYRAPHSKT